MKTTYRSPLIKIWVGVAPDAFFEPLSQRGGCGVESFVWREVRAVGVGDDTIDPGGKGGERGGAKGAGLRSRGWEGRDGGCGGEEEGDEGDTGQVHY